MRSRGIIFENFFVLVGYFWDIPLSVRVKIPILRDTLKKYSTRKVFFFKNQSPWIKDKTKKEV
jgi:hypothetical protein